MYKSVRVKNFRGLRDLALDDVGRVNLVVGANNVGKTSLLEALWLFQGAGNPLLTRNLAAFRGFDPVPVTPELLWHGLFYNLTVANEIEVNAIDTNDVAHSLRLTLAHAQAERISTQQEELQPESLAGTVDSMPLIGETLQFQYVRNGQQPIITTATFSPTEINFERSAQLSQQRSIFLSMKRHTTPQQMAERFTKVQDKGRLPAIISSLRHFEPNLKSLTLGFVEGRPLVRGQTEMAYPVPLPLLGDGFIRLFEILLAIPDAQNGMVFIDEVENGLYFRNLENAWRAIDIASLDAASQIFATTHSWECTQAAITAFSGEHADAFRLHRLERKKGEIRAVTYDHETAHTAIDMDFEVR